MAYLSRRCLGVDASVSAGSGMGDPPGFLQDHAAVRGRRPAPSPGPQLCFLLPAPFRRLLPVGDLAAGGLGGLPLLARVCDSAGIVAVEHVDDALVACVLTELGAVDEKAHGG